MTYSITFSFLPDRHSVKNCIGAKTTKIGKTESVPVYWRLLKRRVTRFGDIWKNFCVPVESISGILWQNFLCYPWANLRCCKRQNIVLKSPIHLVTLLDNKISTTLKYYFHQKLNKLFCSLQKVCLLFWVFSYQEIRRTQWVP